MENIIIQKRGSLYRKYTLLHDKIIVETKDLKKINKYEVSLDRIGFRLQYQAESGALIIKIISIFFLLCGIVFISLKIFGQLPEYSYPNVFALTILCFLFSFLFYIKKPQDDIFLVGGRNNLVFYRAIPNEEKVLEFINLIIAGSKNYMKEIHAKVDPTINEELFYSKLHWLKSIEVISEMEMEELKNEYRIKKLF